jgi:hypothetical protein
METVNFPSNVCFDLLNCKLMAAANPDSLTTANIQGFLPLHFACKVEDSLAAETSSG